MKTKVSRVWICHSMCMVFSSLVSDESNLMYYWLASQLCWGLELMLSKYLHRFKSCDLNTSWHLFCTHTISSIRKCVVCTWNYIWFWIGCEGSWIWKNVLKLELKGLKIWNKLAQTLTPIKPPKNNFTMSKSGLQFLLKWKNHTTLVDTWELGIFVGFLG